MQSTHFIRVLQELYERVYSAMKSGALTDAAEAQVLDVAIWAADCCAENRWGDSERAGRIAAALVRARFGDAEQAMREANELGAWTRLGMAQEDPAPRNRE